MTTNYFNLQLQQFSKFENAAKLFREKKDSKYLYKVTIRWESTKSDIKFFYHLNYFNVKNIYKEIETINITKYKIYEFENLINQFTKFYNRCSNIQKTNIEKSELVNNLLTFIQL